MADSYTYLDSDQYLWTHTDDTSGLKTYTVRSMTTLRAQKTAYDNQSSIALAALVVGTGLGCIDPG